MTDTKQQQGQSALQESKKPTGPILTSDIGTRINEVCGRVGGKKRLAEMIDLSEAQLHRIVAGDSQAKIETIAAIAAAAGVSIDWLATGERVTHPSEGAEAVKESPGAYRAGKNAQPSSEYALVPLYDVRAAAGYGAEVETEQVIDALAFKREWIRQELHANPSDLYLIYVDGESMEPTLRPGDIILIDRRSAHQVPRDGVYVMRMDGTLLVKRLQRLPAQRVSVTSDNPAYAPFELDLQTRADDVDIIGRVVWVGRRM